MVMFSINLGERNGKMLDLLENHDSPTNSCFYYLSFVIVDRIEKIPLKFF